MSAVSNIGAWIFTHTVTSGETHNQTLVVTNCENVKAAADAMFKQMLEQQAIQGAHNRRVACWILLVCSALSSLPAAWFYKKNRLSKIQSLYRLKNDLEHAFVQLPNDKQLEYLRGYQGCIGLIQKKINSYFFPSYSSVKSEVEQLVQQIHSEEIKQLKEQVTELNEALLAKEKQKEENTIRFQLTLRDKDREISELHEHISRPLNQEIGAELHAQTEENKRLRKEIEKKDAIIAEQAADLQILRERVGHLQKTTARIEQFLKSKYQLSQLAKKEKNDE